jgi:hypothetical protein
MSPGVSTRGTIDPDGDSLSFPFFHYPEAGAYRGQITFPGAENLVRIALVTPKVFTSKRALE